MRGLQEADKFVDDLSVAEGLDGGDALDLEARCELRVGFGVDLDEFDRPATRGDSGFDNRRELLAGPAPIGPEIDDDRNVMGGLDDFALEVGLGDINSHALMVGETRLSLSALASQWSRDSRYPSDLVS